MGDYVTDFHLSFSAMNDHGWEVQVVPWRSDAEWDSFDAVYVCAPWDYPQHPIEFIAALEKIEASSAALFNDLSLVRWNLEKSYLRDVERRGGDIVPSRWYDDFVVTDVATFFHEHKTDKVVIKPTIGANAADIYVLRNPVNDELLAALCNTFSQRRFFVQPFIENIQSEGEYSLLFFNGVYSHAILKTPTPGDFRVQEEHGAAIVAVTPPDALLATAQAVFAGIEPLPVYGRGDWVRDSDGRFLLMELELIEPSLYLRTDSAAPSRFARAVNEWFQELTGK